MLIWTQQVCDARRRYLSSSTQQDPRGARARAERVRAPVWSGTAAAKSEPTHALKASAASPALSPRARRHRLIKTRVIAGARRAARARARPAGRPADRRDNDEIFLFVRIKLKNN
ncbi:hypothetical protein EVAR_53036_1 [Eumeta japonica]|uniref:Uncharacterized protein n=1 Tax=Eumeta variegata TaxID=151549 RepID=A0A4C1XQM0_EUMVA|nr:hypothetical protein EVAR_53036_1 [Eumeta japonica]